MWFALQMKFADANSSLASLTHWILNDIILGILLQDNTARYNAQYTEFFGGVFWCSKRAARPAAGGLCRIRAVFISVIRSSRTPGPAQASKVPSRNAPIARAWKPSRE